MQASLSPRCSVISLRSNSLRFYTENFPDFFNAAEKNAGSTIKHSFYRKEKNYRSRDIAKFKSISGEALINFEFLRKERKSNKTEGRLFSLSKNDEILALENQLLN